MLPPSSTRELYSPSSRIFSSSSGDGGCGEPCIAFIILFPCLTDQLINFDTLDTNCVDSDHITYSVCDGPGLTESECAANAGLTTTMDAEGRFIVDVLGNLGDLGLW